MRLPFEAVVQGSYLKQAMSKLIMQLNYNNCQQQKVNQEKIKQTSCSIRGMHLPFISTTHQSA